MSSDDQQQGSNEPNLPKRASRASQMLKQKPCLAGLQPLIHLDGVLLKEDLQSTHGCAYDIFDETTTRIYRVEDPGYIFNQKLMSTSDGSQMTVLDNNGDGFVFRKTLQKGNLEVFASSTEETLGRISIEEGCCCCSYPEFDISGADGPIVFAIRSPNSWRWNCERYMMVYDNPFDIMSFANDGVVAGQIKKEFRGKTLVDKVDTGNFFITFPVDLDVNMKAVLVAMGAYLIGRESKHSQYRLNKRHS